METRYYIAYGSNLSLEQMATRCPQARVAGISLIRGWKLCYRTHATIEPAKDQAVPVLIWTISERDEKNLDLYEGYPDYYVKQDMRVTMTDLDGKNPREITAMVYLMTEGNPLRRPWDGYLATLEEGYRRFGFDPAPLELALRQCQEEEDT